MRFWYYKSSALRINITLRCNTLIHVIPVFHIKIMISIRFPGLIFLCNITVIAESLRNVDPFFVLHLLPNNNDVKLSRALGSIQINVKTVIKILLLLFQGKFPTTPPPQKRNKLYPDVFHPLTKSPSHESQLSMRVNLENDLSK